MRERLISLESGKVRRQRFGHNDRTGLFAVRKLKRGGAFFPLTVRPIFLIDFLTFFAMSPEMVFH